MSLSSGPCPPTEVGSDAATCPMDPSGLWTIGIKKGLAALGMQLGSRVTNVCSRVTEAPARCADKRCYYHAVEEPGHSVHPKIVCIERKEKNPY
jgi:hypothetical protein